MADASEPKPAIHIAALDGLRGLALLGVLLFHADGVLPGGYLGVDLFFVLSGYLITSLLVREYRDTGRIDLYRFWVRRCRRLFPALLSLMPAIAVYGRFFARADELQTLRGEALASLGYYANWHAIFGHRSYWQLFAAPSPLEHTWSLSIEEQFYVVWPLVAAFVLQRRGPRALLALALALTGASVVAMLLMFSPAETSRAYLGTDTRMAAILAGAALALVLAPGAALPATRARQLDWLGTVAGLGLAVAWCTLRGTNTWLYRGGFWLTELAVLVLIACAVMAQNSRVARALSLPPLRWLGTISYGVYLWHWPVNVFLTAERAQLRGAPLQGLRLAITFAIAIVSYRYLERPIRRHGIPFKRASILLPATVALAVFLIVHSTDARADSATGPLDAYNALFPGQTPRDRIVVLGDSTANSIGWGLRSLHGEGVQVALLGKDGCTMLGDRCNGERWLARVREARPDATLVYVAGAFLHGFGAKDGWHTACYADWDAQFEQALTRRLRDLEQAPSRIFIATAPYPLGHWDTADYRAQVDCINASIRKAAAAAPTVRLLEVAAQLCPAGHCQTELANKKLIRPDGVHFSIAGAHDTAHWILDQIRRRD